MYKIFFLGKSDYFLCIMDFDFDNKIFDYKFNIFIVFVFGY